MYVFYLNKDKKLYACYLIIVNFSKPNETPYMTLAYGVTRIYLSFK